MTEVTSGVMVRPQHIRQAKICMKGARDWFELHGIPWSEVVSDGVAVERLEATGDFLADPVIKAAKAGHGR